MKHIGIYLGVSRDAGGMFQYSETIFQSLMNLPQNEYQIVAVGASADWQELLKDYPCIDSRVVPQQKLGELLAFALISLTPSLSMARWINHLVNPSVASINAMKFDLMMFPAQELLAGCVKLRKIVSVHDLMHRYEPGFPEVSSLGRYYLREKRFKAIAENAQLILTDSIVGKQQFQTAYDAPLKGVASLPYCVPPLSDNPHENRCSLKDKYGLPEKFLFYPAQFWEHKNHRRLFLVLKKLKNEFSDIHLVVTGSNGTNSIALKKFAEDIGVLSHITWCSEVSKHDLPQFFRDALGMVMPSFFGPTNIPPLEAMKFGCPMAISRIYAMPEQIGEAALYFDPASLSEMTAAIQSLWSSRQIRDRMVRRGMERTTNWNEVTFETRLHILVKEALLPN